jgi:GNAT superfamily N-acetyltransferase
MRGALAPPPAAAERQRAELAGYRDMWRAAPADLAARHGIATIDVAGGACLACASQAGSPMLNHVVGLGVTETADEAALDRVARFYAGLGVAYSVAASPAAGDLGARLEARGFGTARPWMTFHRTAGPASAPDTDLRLVEAGPRTASAFGGIVATAFGMPPDFCGWLAALPGRPGWRCLLALAGDVPVGAGALFAQGDAGWVTLGATLPEHRGRGAQSALFAERVRRASGLGLRHLVTETGAPVGDEGPGPSYRNMLRAGFAEVELRPNYSSPAS